MTTPRRWTLTELGQDAETAKREFRQTRLREPVEHYSAFFRSFAPIAAATIDRLGQLMADPIDARAVAEQIASIMADTFPITWKALNEAQEAN